MRKILKLITVLIHKFIVYFMVLGVASPKKILIFFTLTWPLVYLSWQINNNKCILTEIEYYLDNNSLPPPSATDDHDYPFIRNMIGDYNMSLTNKQIHYCIMALLTLIWLVGVVRYLRLHNMILIK